MRFKDIQQKISLIRYCKTMYYYRRTTEYIYHIGNAFEMHSIIKRGLIPGGKSLRRDRQSVFFTAVNPMDARQDLKEVEYDLDKPRIGPCKHTWKAHHNTNKLVQFEACSEKGIAILSNLITCSYSFKKTLPAIWKEKVVCMKTGEELYCKVYESPRVLRVTFVPNSQHDQKDLPITDSRKADDWERLVAVVVLMFWIPGIQQSIVEKVETNPKETVRRLIEQIENHRNRNMLLKDFEKSEGINHFSRESKDLTEDACSPRRWINNTTKTDLT